MAQSNNSPKPYSTPIQGFASPPRQQQDPPPYNDPPVYPDSQPPVEYAIFIHRPGAGQRFLSAFFVATFIWVLFTLLVQSSVTALQFGHKHRGRSVGDYAVPSQFHSNTCVEGTDWKQDQASSSLLRINIGADMHISGSASFTLPISSDTLFLISRGQNLGGSVEVITSPNQAAQSVTVNVEVASNSEDALQQTMACLLTRNANENGVGIFTPTGMFPGWWNSNFHITVVLPENGSGTPLHIKDFETDLPNSSHQIGDLSQKILFETLSLSGSNGQIAVQSLATTSGKINTSNGAISGTYNSTNSLLLSTTNSAITVDVGLTALDGSKPTLTARTDNGAIDANISLLSPSGSGGSFIVTAQTMNQPLNIAFPTSPAGSELNLKASTSNGPASVFLDSAYAGSFNLETSSFSDATVNVVRNISARHVRYNGVQRGATSGTVVWNNESSSNGRVSVSTSNGRALLEL